jgi:hypothetical protein
MHVQIPHAFSKEEASTRVKRALNEARGTLAGHAKDFTERWEGDTLHFSATLQGKHIEGTLEVKEKEFELNAKLPLLWRMFEGQIEKAIKEQVSQLR